MKTEVRIDGREVDASIVDVRSVGPSARGTWIALGILDPNFSPRSAAFVARVDALEQRGGLRRRLAQAICIVLLHYVRAVMRRRRRP